MKLLELIRLSKSSVDEQEKNAISRVIDKGYLGMGAEVEAFELDISNFLRTKMEVICVNSGTAALHLALDSMDIGFGDEVLVPAITYAASWQAISATGAIPVACDVNEENVFINIKDAEKKLTENTRAIMPVHYASDSQDMPEVLDFSDNFELRVIEDAAHSFGSTRDGKLIGYDGDLICFSFDGIKNITSGEGGAILTSDPKLAERIRDARLLGVVKDSEKRYKNSRSWEYEIKHQGWRYHMSNIMAAIGREQIKKIDQFAKHRRDCVKHYLEELSTLSEIDFLNLDYEHILPHIFPIKVLSGKRDILIERLHENNIQYGIHYQPINKLSYFSITDSFPIADKLGEQLISLPLHAELTEVEQERVITTIKNCLE